MQIPLKGGKEFEPTEVDIAGWVEAYPNIDVMSELKKLREWNKANVPKRKTKQGIRRHINYWLTKANIKATPADWREKAKERIE